MADNLNNQGRRIIFNSKLAILDPPEARYKGEWPKKPPYWQIYGTSAAKTYMRIIFGITAAGTVLSYVFYKFQQKVNLGYLDRYVTPELFYSERDKERYRHERQLQLNSEDLSQFAFNREDLGPTKEYRKKLESLEVALEKERSLAISGFKPI